MTMLRKSVKVVSCTGEAREQHPGQLWEKIGLIGVIVDISDAHGLCYGLVFPNEHGYAGRLDSLPVFWFEPDEIELVTEGV